MSSWPRTNPAKLLMAGLLLASLITPVRAMCDGVPLLVNHDDTFETGYAWECGGGDRGAFAEGFRGPGTVCGIQFFLCTVSYVNSEDVFVFVWDSEDGRPGSILAMAPGQVQNHPPCGGQPLANELPITAPVGSEFFVGVSQCSTDWPMSLRGDSDGPASGDQCWLQPGNGWQRVNDVWPSRPVHSLSMGVYLDTIPSPVTPADWGSIKKLFRK
jgi:hypothetical protein